MRVHFLAVFLLFTFADADPYVYDYYDGLTNPILIDEGPGNDRT